MGESMSKRLKLQLGGEAEMEERAFANPYPDYQPQGAAAAQSAAEAQRDRVLLPPEEDPLPFDSDGKVSPGRELPCAPRGLLRADGLLAAWMWGGLDAVLASLPKGGAVPVGRGACPKMGTAFLRYRVRPVRVWLGQCAEGRGAAERPRSPPAPRGPVVPQPRCPEEGRTSHRWAAAALALQVSLGHSLQW